VARARLDGGVVAAVRAMEDDDAHSLWTAFVTGGLAVSEMSGAAPEILAGLSTLDPDIAARYPAARGAAPASLPDAILGAIAAIAEQRPLLLALDDASRAPDDVVTLLMTAVQRGAGRPLMLLLGAARSQGHPREALDEVISRTGRDVPGTVIRTAPFEPGDLAALVRWAFPDYQEDAVSRLVRRAEADTNGNPFLAVELVRALRDGLKLPEGRARPWPAARHTLDDTRPGDLPESLAAALRLRFRQLSEPAQQVLAAVAVVGGRAGREALAHGAGVASPVVDLALDELEWSRWLAADVRGYQFVTRLAREMVLQDMVTGGQQRRIRERVATLKRS
jgi:hypothetical protein